MSVPSIVAQGRRVAEARMLSTCTIHRRTGSRTTGADGMDVDGWSTTYTALPVRISGAVRGASPTTGRSQQGTEVNEAYRTANLPASTTNLADGDHIEVTAGDCAGLVFRITEANWQDQATARRVPVEAVERPQEW